MAHSFAISSIRSERIRAFYRYWAKRRNGKAMPAGADLDPSEIKPLLPSIIVSEIRDEPFRIFYRLVGTEVTRRTHRDFIGRHLHDLDFDTDEARAECHRLVCARRRPLFGQCAMRRRDGFLMTMEYAILPLSEVGDAVSRCFTIVDCESVAQHAT